MVSPTRSELRIGGRDPQRVRILDADHPDAVAIHESLAGFHQAADVEDLDLVYIHIDDALAAGLDPCPDCFDVPAAPEIPRGGRDG